MPSRPNRIINFSKRPRIERSFICLFNLDFLNFLKRLYRAKFIKSFGTGASASWKVSKNFFVGQN